MSKDENGDSVCEGGDVSELANIIKNVFIDKPSNQSYNFDYNPPYIYGQIGVPEVVDRILGKYHLPIVCRKQLPNQKTLAADLNINNLFLF